MKKIRQIIHRFVKFSGINIVFFFLSLVAAFALNRYLEINPFISITVGLGAVCLVHYFLGLYWIFPESVAHQHKGKGFARALIVTILTFFAIWGIIYLIVNYTSINVYAARTVSGCVMSILEYGAHSTYTHGLHWHGLPHSK